MNAPLIRTSGLEKRFGDVHALRGVSFTIDRPGIVAIVGANGAGKTTLMRMLAGLVVPSAGAAAVCGHPIEEGGQSLSTDVGYLAERLSLYPDLRVEESLQFVCALRGYRGDLARERVDRVIDEVGLAGFRRRVVATLSKGYRQRLGLAQAILHEPKVLILDEPFSGFDPLQRVDIRQLLFRLAKERLVLFSTHVLTDVERLASRIVVLSDGRIVADGQLGSLSDQVGLRSWFELHLDGGPDVAEAVGRLDCVDEVRQGEHGQLEVVATNALPDALNALAREHSWTIRRLTAVRPTLEDVFVALTGGDL